jgi:hypothetical protein
MTDAGSRGNAGTAPEKSDNESLNLAPAAVPDNIVIAKFWKSRSRSEHIQVSIFQWHELPLVDVRVFVDEGGISKPSKKGVCLNINKSDQLVAALVKARAKAVALGWLE